MRLGPDNTDDSQTRRPATSPRVPRSRASPYGGPGREPQRTDGRCPATASPPLRGGASHEAEGRRGARDSSAGRVRAPAGRLRLLRQAVRQRRMGMPSRWKTSGLVGSRRARRRARASAMGCEMGRIRPTNVFERAGESRMTPPASGILTTLSLVHRRLDNPIRTHVP